MSIGLASVFYARGRYPLWTAAALLLVAVIATPYVPLVVSLFTGGGESWEHVRSTVLGRYAANTVFLVGGTTFGAAAIGVAGAWMLERYRLPMPRMLELVFIAPFAFPAYILTFTWNGILAYRGSFEQVVGIYLPFGGLWAAILMLVLALYPYVYLTTRAALTGSSRVLFDVVASLSAGVPGNRQQHLRQIWRGVIPSLRPAVVGGASLVVMATMNAYATPVFLGVETLSTGVFRTWFGLKDLPTATFLAAIVLVVMFTLLTVERYGRGRRRYTPVGSAPLRQVHLSRIKTAVVMTLLLLPPLLGFFIPIAQLVRWTILEGGSGLAGLGVTVGRTVSLAVVTTLVILVVAVLLNLVGHLRPGWVMNGTVRIAGIGYAVPGTVVAIGVLAVFEQLRLVDERLFFFGTVGGLVFAYVSRYFALANQPVQSAFARQHRTTVDAARSLGSGPAGVLTRVVLPVFRPTLAGAGLLVAIDVIKDLPMTLLLRPFDFNTLAVEVFRLAQQERMPEASPRALLLVAVGMLTMWVILSSTNRREEGR